MGPPLVGSANPNTGPSAGGTSVVLTATAGLSLTGTTAVRFGTLNATSFTVDSSTQITAVSPAHSSGTVNIGTTTNGAPFAGPAYTYV